MTFKSFNALAMTLIEVKTIIVVIHFYFILNIRTYKYGICTVHCTGTSDGGGGGQGRGRMCIIAHL
jgi:hypothetical protein